MESWQWTLVALEGHLQPCSRNPPTESLGPLQTTILFPWGVYELRRCRRFKKTGNVPVAPWIQWEKKHTKNMTSTSGQWCCPGSAKTQEIGLNKGASFPQVRAGWNVDMQFACAPGPHHITSTALAKVVSWRRRKLAPVSHSRASQLHNPLCPQCTGCLLQLSDHWSSLTAEELWVLLLGSLPAALCCLQPHCSTTAPWAQDTQAVSVIHLMPNKMTTFPLHQTFIFIFFFKTINNPLIIMLFSLPLFRSVSAQ